MTIQKIVIHQYTVERPQPLLEVQYSSHNRLAEVAGGTTAECAAVCCCCPFALVNLLVLAVYGVPAGLCRKALRKKRRRRLLKKGLLVQDGDVSSHRGSSSYDAAELLIHEAIRYDVTEVLIDSPAERFMMAADSDVIEIENEMWDKFYGTGFWRSASQRVD
ncbi:uncharacterized protein LOC112519802 [Cynara cardunculus var. scolymus]|uniref:Uncharacterized protein n=1 Tax=Cynara cardunculus var. scolymus TaxID=59895 RepID=A0A124SEH6_CYNCS|nr:uncharacterized protein LOC112519802 [Cynara cardunculus var. scolymus]KVI00063.1 hypothetical protein Ccrd_021703 [Cynara cardunculus var. scolymus]